MSKTTVIYGTEGDDTLYGKKNVGQIYAEGGNDTIVDTASHIPDQYGRSSYLYGGDGDDHITAGKGNNVLYGGRDNDALSGGAGNDSLYGGNHFDPNSGTTRGDDTLYGGDGNDLLVGGNGNDHIYGGAGNDTILSFQGGGKISGGSGADTFCFINNTFHHSSDPLAQQTGYDAGSVYTYKITDFDVTQDKLYFLQNTVKDSETLAIKSYENQTAIALVTHAGEDTIITLGKSVGHNNTVITLVGVDADAWSHVQYADESSSPIKVI